MKLLCSINLYAERLAQEEAKKPRRRLIAGSALTVLALGLTWFGLHLHVAQLAQENATTFQLETDLNRQVAAGRERALHAAPQSERGRIVRQFLAERFRVAPLLEDAFASIPENVELSELHWRTLDGGGGELTLRGRAAGQTPRLECDKCRLLLTSKLQAAGYEAASRFASLEDSTDTIRLNDQDTASANFVLVLKLKPTRQGHEPGEA